MKPIHQSVSSVWATFDAQIVRQLYDDLELIAEQNGEAFQQRVRNQVAEAWRDEADARYDVLPTPGARLARNILPIDPTVIEDVFRWCRGRRRLRELADEVRREAKRIRNAPS